ncbi:MAG TPA: glycoside hydrolase family 32 protein [Terracidiphilus sp.]|jgi:beta-fructofuranosidase|nr:glycoside hydrolase family 32 protein [Terracidiphilus sp.]
MKQDRRDFLKSLGYGSAAGVLLTGRSRASLALREAMQANIGSIAHDPLRPEFHLMPPHNWMNDPNGPIWWKGQYHLFYQLNPHAAVWGAMHWGHAVSPDMIRWRHQPIALAPTPGGPDSEGCFSGSAVVFEGKPAFIYTGVQNASPDQATIRDGSDKLRETQMLATAEDDKLVRWKKVEKPIIPAPPPGMMVTGFRDPCPWREGEMWYLGIGSGEREVGGCVLLYRSRDLRHWEYLHKLVQGKPNGKVAVNPCDSGEMWECPDFFAVDGHHVLLYSSENKVFWTTGEYDTHEHLYIPMRTGVLDQGASYYAPKSFVAPDGRRILWGWMRETRPEAEFAAAGWSGAMSLPRVLTVDRDGHLEMNPAAECEKLRGSLQSANVTAAAPVQIKLDDLRRELHIPLAASPKFAVRLLTNGEKAWELVVDVPGRMVSCGEISVALPQAPWTNDALRIFLDASVIETFILGREAITSRVYNVAPGKTELHIELLKGESVQVKHWPLQAISRDRLTS